MASPWRSHASPEQGSRGLVGTGHGAAHRAGAQSPGSQRELLWDAIRAVAIVRVLAWHAWG